ncbi:MAG: hypothetical protein AB7T63_00145 [Planctomycetota bacterium]
MRRQVLAITACAAALLAIGCTSTPTDELPVVDVSQITLRPEGATPRGDVDDVLVVGGPWERFEPVPPAVEIGDRGPYADGALPTAAAQSAEDTRELSALERLLARSRGAEPPRPHQPPLRAPVPRGGQFIREVGKPSLRTPEELARDHVLDWPTRIEAREVTFYCPASAARELELRGDEMRDLGTHGPRVAYGNAHLRCRELSIVADRITVRVLPPGEDALRIVARRDVRYALRVRERVFQDEGLKSLMVLNDQLVPLR